MFWLAEAFNSLSSIPIIVIGALGLYHSYGLPGRHTRRYMLAYAGFITVGIGSALFHATLRY